MSNELARIQTAVIPTADEWSTIHSMAKALLPTGFLPSTIKTPEQATAIILKGRELNIPPMYALSNIIVIQGKPACGAELLQALIYRDHGDEALRFTESTNDQCTIEYRRRSWKKPERYTFTMGDAERAGLLKNPTWKQYPAAMLRARCLSAVARMAFADSIGGMYTSEELGAAVRVVDGVVELDDSAIVDAPVTRPEPRSAVVTVAAADDDPTITATAVGAINAKRDERKLTAEDVLALMTWHGFEAERLEELTVEQGRALYRFMNTARDADLHEAVYHGMVLIAEPDVAEDDNIDIEHDNTPTTQDMLAAFDANQRTAESFR